MKNHISGKRGSNSGKNSQFGPNFDLYRPLIRSIIYQQVMLKGPEPPKSPQKLVLQENLSISVFYIVILGIFDT